MTLLPLTVGRKNGVGWLNDHAKLVYITLMEVQFTSRRPHFCPVSCPNADCQLLFTVLTLDTQNQTFSGLEQSFCSFCFNKARFESSKLPGLSWHGRRYGLELSSEHGDRSANAQTSATMINSTRERNLHPSKKKGVKSADGDMESRFRKKKKKNNGRNTLRKILNGRQGQREHNTGTKESL